MKHLTYLSLLLILTFGNISCSHDHESNEPNINSITRDLSLVGTWKRTETSWSYKFTCTIYAYFAYTFNMDGTGHYKLWGNNGGSDDIYGDFVYEYDFTWKTSNKELIIVKTAIDYSPDYDYEDNYSYSISEDGKTLTLNFDTYILQ